MKLYEIISNLKFLGIKNYLDMDIDSLTCSSLEPTNKSIYFCIKGTKVDGHDYAEQAIQNAKSIHIKLSLEEIRYINDQIPSI